LEVSNHEGGNHRTSSLISQEVCTPSMLGAEYKRTDVSWREGTVKTDFALILGGGGGNQTCQRFRGRPDESVASGKKSKGMRELSAGEKSQDTQQRERKEGQSRCQGFQR